MAWMDGSFKLLFFYSIALVSKLPVQLVDSSQTIWPELTKLPKHKYCVPKISELKNQLLKVRFEI